MLFNQQMLPLSMLNKQQQNSVSKSAFKRPKLDQLKPFTNQREKNIVQSLSYITEFIKKQPNSTKFTDLNLEFVSRDLASDASG